MEGGEMIWDIFIGNFTLSYKMERMDFWWREGILAKRDIYYGRSCVCVCYASHSCEKVL